MYHVLFVLQHQIDLLQWNNQAHVWSLCSFVFYLVCTPVGLSRMFTVMGQLLVKPTVSNHKDND